MAQSHTSYSTTRGEVTSKWPDVIKNSVQIATEPKQTYLLNTAKIALNKDGTARTYTFIRKDLKRNRTIMMVGETGTGKSSLINMMVNYMLGVKWEDKIRFEIIPDESKRPQTESQATVITAYEIFGLEELSVPFSLTVIDMPGYGDTRSLDKDKQIAQNLYTFLESLSDVQQIDAVCLVVKASQYRLSPSQKYIFDAILSVFGKNMEKNFMILITFSDWMPPPALKLVSESGAPFLKDENNEPVHFLFNNLPPQKFAKKYEETYKTAWDNGTESFREFFETLDKMEPQSLGEIKNVLKQHQCLEDFFLRLESQIRVVEEKHKAFEDVQKTLEEHRQDLEKNNNFEDKKNVRKKIRIGKSILFCPVCVALCPHPSVLQSNSSNCSACPKKCSYEVHNINEEIFVEQNEERTGISEDLNKEAEGKISAAEKEMSKCEKELKHAEARKTNLMESCFQCILQLRDLALKFDSTSTRQKIPRLIEMLKEYNDTEKVETLQKILGNTA
ncbi:uncharacterized protein LOC118234296 [Anguilla anguilla]|uniref:uncharacterized protein LOC118234296 n=1 Tax=Anguilla anguilla TaxID=7936 RepID=UPI0015B30CAB|nr:uncharacterized protein LOC118234296 [Anguilla anguilla]